MRLIYTFLFYLLIPFILLRLLWRGRHAPAYWHRWLERFGFSKITPVQPTLWIHAVSMGEVQAAIPLIQALEIRYPHNDILITTMTPTGSQRVCDVFGERVWHVYLPYDLPDSVARFLTRAQPSLLILMETELWPNLLSACHQRSIPVILANARLSIGSAAGYQRISGLVGEMFNCITAVVAQTPVDAKRFLALGADPTKISTSGSIKFDTHLPINFSEKAQHLRCQWGKERAVWIAASTHEGEEKIVLDVFTTLKQTYHTLLLVLVPRHPERFNHVNNLAKQRGFIISRRSKADVHKKTDIYLGDTMGDLPLLYASCDVAFVGGTLVPVGGHNLLEPAAVGIPVIMGPHVFECAEICRQLLEVNAATQITDTQQLAQAVTLYLSDAPLNKHTGDNGRLFVVQNRGALERLLIIIDKHLTK